MNDAESSKWPRTYRLRTVIAVGVIAAVLGLALGLML